jgi:hypothetical protein
MSHDAQKKAPPALSALLEAAAGTCNEAFGSGLPYRSSLLEPISQAEAQDFLTKLATRTNTNIPKPGDF